MARSRSLPDFGMRGMFDDASDVDRTVPLAARMRPRTLNEIVGQVHLVGPNAPLRRAIEADSLPLLHPLRTAGPREDLNGPGHCSLHRGAIRNRFSRLQWRCSIAQGHRRRRYLATVPPIL